MMSETNAKSQDIRFSAYWRSFKNCLKYPIEARLLKPLVIASLGLSFWQFIQSFFSLLPKMPAQIYGLAQVLGGMAGFLILLMAPGILVEIISRTTQRGDPDLSLKGLAGQAEKIVMATLKAAVISIWSFLPLEIYFALLVKSKSVPSFGLTGVLLLLGLIYFPMSLLLLAVSGKTMSSLLVSNVLEPMTRTAGSYAGFLFPFWAMMLLPLAGLQLWPVPFIGPWAACFILFYSCSCAMKLLGEFYLLNRDKIKKP